MNNDLDKIKAYRLLTVNEKDQMEAHHVWFWSADKKVRQYLLEFHDVPTGEVAEAKFLRDAKDREILFVPCFSSQ